MKTYNFDNIIVNSSYRKLEFVKNGRVCYILSKYTNQDRYSLFDVRRGTINFFIDGWDRNKLIKHYVALCN